MSKIIEKLGFQVQNNRYSDIRSFLKWLSWSTLFCSAISLYGMYSVHYNYWGSEDRTAKNQGTIFAVQTVEFNIASSAFAPKISQLLASNKPEDSKEIQKLLNSAYGLLGFIVSDCKMAIGDCVDEEILYRSNYENRTWWLNRLINSGEYKKSDFDLLRKPQPIYQEYSYESSKNHQRTSVLPPDHQQIKDTIIGRVYYIRNPPPSFLQQLSYWYSNNLNPSSTDAKYYSRILVQFLFVAIIASILLWLHEKKGQLEETKKLEAEIQLRIEQEKLNVVEKQHRLQLEDLMAMFAHKFRGPLDSLDFNFRNGCLNQERFMHSLETMRGLLNTFSTISTDSVDFVKIVKSDISGSQTVFQVLQYSLEFVIGHLTTRNKITSIHQHYLRYAKKHNLVEQNLEPRDWVKNYAPQEIELQQIFSEAFLSYEKNKDDSDIFILISNLFFKLKIIGFDKLLINFKPFEHKSSFLTIILSEILTNAFKYYSLSDHQEVSLAWIELNDMIIIRCITPSSKMERRQSKGSGKGHFFLKRLAEMVGGAFSFQYPDNDSTPCITEITLPKNLFYIG